MFEKRIFDAVNFMGRGVRCSVALIFCVTMPLTEVLALPQGASVESGEVQFEQPDAQTLNVQTSDTAVIQWQSFDIGEGETVNFFQPFESRVLNNIFSNSVSQILGTLNATGTVFLVNPAGIHFGSSASVNVGSLVASTLAVSLSDFLQGSYSFSRFSGQEPGQVVNEGSILTREGGFAALLGGAVQNTGHIEAPLGTVALASGEQIALHLDTKGLVSVAVDGAVANQLFDEKGNRITDAVRNDGLLKADGGKVILTAEAVDQIFNRLVNVEGLGIVEANSVGERNGVIELVGSSGLVRNAGLLRAEGAPVAGRIDVRGRIVQHEGVISVNAADGGQAGEAYVISQNRTVLKSGSLIEAKGVAANGIGGRVIVNSLFGDTIMQRDAVVNVSGGALMGDAGFIDISAKEGLGFHGRVIGIAQPGYQGGTVVFDPKDIKIENDEDDTVDGGDSAIGTPDEAFGESSGQTLKFNPKAGGAFTGFQQIYLQATRDITIEDPFDVPTAVGGSGTASLKLEAQRDIKVEADISTAGQDIELIAGRNVVLENNKTISTTGAGKITITADANSDGSGKFDVKSGSSVTTGGGNITVSGAGNQTVRTLNAGSGNVTFTSTNGGRIDDDGDNSTKITADALTLTAGGRIGNTGGNDQLDTSVNTLNATASSGRIVLANDKGMTITSASSTDGSVTITTAGNTTATSISATGTGTNDVSLTASSGDILVGSITADDDITLTATAGAINESGSDAAADLVGSLATLTASTGIGASGAIETTLSSLSAEVTGAGSINLSETDALTVTEASLKTANGDITLQTGGNMLLGLVNAAGAVTLTATGSGSILDNNSGSNNIVATANSLLTAGGTIGTSTDPLDVNITGGTLGVSAAGVSDEVAVNISGTVSPTNDLLMFGSINPPGRVIFNGTLLYPLTLASVDAVDLDPVFNAFRGAVDYFSFAARLQNILALGELGPVTLLEEGE